MTSKYFWTDPYLTRLKTRVTAATGNEVSLESTILFAFSGGQESDHGSIGGYPVINARKHETDIVYTLPEGHGLLPGQVVEVAIDWARRYQLMRLHFAAELVLELVYRALPGVEKIGAHIAQNKARLDFLWPDSIAPLLAGIAEQVNAIVLANLEIRSAFEEGSGERRYWEIDGFSRVSCGGTHVKRTGEIGPIRLKRNNIGHGKERIEIQVS